MNSITKKCSICGLTKEISEFYSKSYCCKDCSKEKAKNWSLNNRERRKEIARISAKKHKDKSDVWKKNNRESVNKSKRKYYQKKKDYIRSLINKWNKNNPDKIQEYKRNRRAREEGSGGYISAKEWKNLCVKYGNKCLCCGSKNKKLTLDHVIPLALGGKHDIENAQPLCLTCNLKKATKIIDYRDQM